MTIKPCKHRRNFLVASATTMATSLLSNLNASNIEKVETQRKKIIALKDMKENEPFYFSYPDEEKNSFIVKLGESAGGGIGEEKDIVAFNHYCTHMGMDLKGHYHKAEKVMGACPMHLTTFDLTRYGMVIAGHATASLPQIELELHNNIIYAVGLSGLIYGKNNNFK